MKRSLEKITRSDLNKLYELSASVMDSFFERNPIYKKPFKANKSLRHFAKERRFTILTEKME